MTKKDLAAPHERGVFLGGAGGTRTARTVPRGNSSGRKHRTHGAQRCIAHGLGKGAEGSEQVGFLWRNAPRIRRACTHLSRR